MASYRLSLEEIIYVKHYIYTSLLEESLKIDENGMARWITMTSKYKTGGGELHFHDSFKECKHLCKIPISLEWPWVV